MVVNNDGYTVERAIHGVTAHYNNITGWRWTDLPAALCVPGALTFRASTYGELDDALTRQECSNPRARLPFMTNAVDPSVAPSGTGCAECDAVGGWWVHLRRCAACGHIGCCDDSPARHASVHWGETGHPIIRSFEPGEDWFWNFETNQYYDGPELAPPGHRPTDGTVPGPRGRVPADWAEQLRRRDG